MILFRHLTQNFRKFGRDGKNYLLYSCSVGKKTIRIVKSLFCELKKGLAIGVIYTSLHDIEFIFKFFWEITYLELEIVFPELHFTYAKH